MTQPDADSICGYQFRPGTTTEFLLKTTGYDFLAAGYLAVNNVGKVSIQKCKEQADKKSESEKSYPLFIGSLDSVGCEALNKLG